ncbi:NB-ARC domain-containing protein [Streptomyces collinus]|uniref:NB-ARC domain-containing protein n=1 Tax=Streptomyces collinus TaxID=42684 RepID=UPI0036808BFE
MPEEDSPCGDVPGNAGEHVDFRDSVFHGPVIGTQHNYYTATTRDADVSALPARALSWLASTRPPVTGREVARPDLYVPLVRRLTARDAGRAVVAARLIGAGGFGKTTLASMIFEAPEVRKRFGKRAYWVSLGEQGSEVEVLSKINALNAELLRESDGGVAAHQPSLDLQQAGERLRELLGAKPTLLVVDDVWSEQHLAPFIGGRGDCVVLITSRFRDIQPDAVPVEVDEMTEEQALQLLLSDLAEVAGVNWHDVLEVIGRCPLVLKLAHGELRERTECGEPLARAVHRIRDDFTSQGPTVWDDRHPIERGLAVAVERSLRYLSARVTQGRERFLELSVFPKGVAVPLRTLAVLWRECMGADQVETLCRQLARLFLVQELQLGKHAWLRLHDVIHDHLVHETGDRLPSLHRRLLVGHDQRHWWQLPDEEPYMWEWAVYHLGHARVGGADDLVCDVRWLEARMDRAGPPGLERDFAHATRQATRGLHEVLVRSYHLLSPRESGSHFAATLIARLHGVEGMQEIAAGFEGAIAGTARLALVGPPADLPHPAFRGTLAEIGARRFAVSQDGKWLVAGHWDGTVSVWDTADGTLLARKRMHHDPVKSVGVLGKSTHVFSSPFRGPAMLWNWRQETAGEDWAWPGSVAGSAVFGSEGRWAVVADPVQARVVEFAGDNPLQFFDQWGAARPTPQALTHRVLHSQWIITLLWLIPVVVSAHDSHAYRVLMSTIGVALTLALATGVKPFVKRRNRHLIDSHDLIHAGAFSSDGTRLVTATREAVSLWRMSNGRRVRVFAQSTDNLQSSLALDPTGSMLAQAGTFTHVFQLWDTNSGRLITQDTLPTAVAIYPSVAFSRNGEWVACGSAETVRVWSVPDGTQRAVLTDFTSPVSDIGFTHDGQTLLTAQVSAPIRRWELSQLLDTPHTAAAERAVYQVAFFPDGGRFVTAGPDHDVTLYLSDGSTAPVVLKGHTSRVLAVTVEPRGQWLASGDAGGNVHLWTSTGELIRSFQAHDKAITALLAGPAGAWLATGSVDNSLAVWNREGVKIRTMRDVDGGKNRILRAVNGLSLLDSGTTLAASGSDGFLRLWDTARWTPRPTINLGEYDSPEEEKTRSSGRDVFVASTRGSLLAGVSGTRRTPVILRKGFTHARHLDYNGTEKPTGMTFSPYETHIACTESNGALSVWSSEDGSCVASLRVDDVLHGCAWCPSTPLIAAGGSCGIYLFELRDLFT